MISPLDFYKIGYGSGFRLLVFVKETGQRPGWTAVHLLHDLQ